VATLDELGHLPEEEGEQQSADVAAVDVGVRHDDDTVVTQLVDLEVVLADTRAKLELYRSQGQIGDGEFKLIGEIE
jgi:hypothetical protein